MHKKCKVCKRIFKKRLSHSKRYWKIRKFCSFSCYAKGKKGVEQWMNRIDGNPKRHSKEMKKCECGCGEKIRVYDNRARLKKFKQGHQNERRRGKKRPELSALMKKGFRTGKYKITVIAGKQHHRYKDGKQCGRNNKKYKEWRVAVLKRDKSTCQMCNKKPKGRYLITHHIKEWDEFPKLRYVINNGLTLCRSCHCKIHNPAISK